MGPTGKGAGPCNGKDAGWARNRAGPAFDEGTLEAPKSLNTHACAGRFADLLRACPKDRPFLFWYGGHEPHRAYDSGCGLRAGKRLEDVRVPAFLPDCPEVHNDTLDYSFEREWFDRPPGRMLELVKNAGELENTRVLVTADNSVPFPAARTKLREYGVGMSPRAPWPPRVRSGRVVADPIGFTDPALTLPEAAGVKVPELMTGRSFLDVPASGHSGCVDEKRTRALSGRERHSHARFDNPGYPCRALRTPDCLYARNSKPELWPAGDPPLYADIDDGPSERYLLERQAQAAVRPFFEMACARRPAEELFDVLRDPSCIRNLADSPGHRKVSGELRAEPDRTLREQRGSRILGGGDVFDGYPGFSPMRPQLGGFAAQGEYNPKYHPPH